MRAVIANRFPTPNVCDSHLYYRINARCEAVSGYGTLHLSKAQQELKFKYLLLQLLLKRSRFLWEKIFCNILANHENGGVGTSRSARH